MSYVIRNPNADRLMSQLTYWGAFSFQQCCYFLTRYFAIHDSETIVRSICQSRKLCYLHGDTNVVSISNFPYITFDEGKEKAIWVYFNYMDVARSSLKVWPKIITKNDFNGVDFILNNKYYSIVYISSVDKTYYSVLKTKLDEKITFIFVTDNKERASTIRTVNSDDKIWYVEGNQIHFYNEELSEG